MDNLKTRQTTNNIKVFDRHFLYTRNLYVHYYGKLPNINYLVQVNRIKAFNAFKDKHPSIKIVFDPYPELKRWAVKNTAQHTSTKHEQS